MNKILTDRLFLIYQFVKSYETKYYPEFVKSGIKIEKELPVLVGAGRILKRVRMDNDVQ